MKTRWRSRSIWIVRWWRSVSWLIICWPMMVARLVIWWRLLICWLFICWTLIHFRWTTNLKWKFHHKCSLVLLFWSYEFRSIALRMDFVDYLCCRIDTAEPVVPNSVRMDIVEVQYNRLFRHSVLRMWLFLWLRRKKYHISGLNYIIPNFYFVVDNCLFHPVSISLTCPCQIYETQTHAIQCEQSYHSWTMFSFRQEKKNE